MTEPVSTSGQPEREPRPSPIEVIVHLRQPTQPHSEDLASLERVSRILAALAIPIILAIIGYLVQSRLQNQAVQREYVTLAVSILQEADSKKAPPELKEWAAQLLDQNAPVKLPAQLLGKLQSGVTVLPDNRQVSGSIGASPDTIRRGESARLSWNSFNATSVVITPDVGPVPLAGSVAVSPSKTTTYTLNISNGASAGSGTATVYVRDKPVEVNPGRAVAPVH